ncbi:MAG: UDP-glucose/GDP-mannose dehydrogenase family protein [Planctomycetota bacterium]|nr:MAG: UDP-glucose/GDP-mannose dehydrogenase family protein [Planctomycetota bacterium]REJ97567.1 MAG: UDP-glucose/GDP-mannose dehydrogenase family protein [Planctomycetota bacterium]REK26906.1 MAG: UDP-glucose/GDP-mannose dehydrogenase family protein [Planctomycetota bacterium]REK35395.1 MAG: UDP-glucose/GDP-mannose dehydrogenase family protein [Planctomycetota bacterium]
MKIVMIGTGYVGLVTGTCLSDSGNDVTCVDIDEKKVELLQSGRIPIYEPGLEELIRRCSKAGRLHFTTDAAAVVSEARAVFLAVGTPQQDDGSADLSDIFAAAEGIAPYLSEDAVVVVKSTVPVGTNRRIAVRLRELTGRSVDVASNPEFLKEGCAVDDFTKPDRVVIGVDRPEVAEVLKEVYEPYLDAERPFLVMGLESAEMTKYVANCFLATKISFINEMANLCERVDADIDEVRKGIGYDRRIGFSFLYPGAGYGGSCFPKDVRAAVRVAEAAQFDANLLKVVDEVNTRQKHVLFEKLSDCLGGKLPGRRVAVWGLAFKPQTDDIREAPALVLIRQLLKVGAEIRVSDPEAMENVRSEFGDRLLYHDDPYAALDGADALVLCTEWENFRSPDLARMFASMRRPIVIDGRNVWEPEEIRASGFKYVGIGRRGGASAG